MIYPITYSGKTTGKAEIIAEGLYYKIDCRCSLPSGRRYYIVAQWEDGEIDLGVCVPSEGEYTLVKRIPQKRFNTENLCFFVNGKSFLGERIRVEKGKNFHQIDRLINAYSEFREGKTYLIFSTDR